MEATKIASLSRLNRNTVNRLSRAVRERMAEACAFEQSEARRVAGDSPGHRAVRILRTRIGRRGGWRIVSAEVLPGVGVQVHVDEAGPETSFDLTIEPATSPPSDPAGDEPRAPAGGGHLRTLDIFWGQAMLRLAKFKGVSRRTYHLHLKECQFRFNHRREDLYALLLRLLRDRPLF